MPLWRYVKQYGPCVAVGAASGIAVLSALHWKSHTPHISENELVRTTNQPQQLQQTKWDTNWDM